MEKGKIVKFDPKLLGALKETMGNLPGNPRDLTKVKALTIFDKHNFAGEPGFVFLNWMEYAPGHFSAVGAMENLHTLQFKNHWVLCVEDFSFLSQLKRLKKLDLSGTNFSDCALLKDLPALQYAILPDRRTLIHKEVLRELPARVETKPEKEARESWHYGFCRTPQGQKKGCGHKTMPPLPAAYTADKRLIQWITVSLGGFPKTPAELMEITQLDSLGMEVSPQKKSLLACCSRELSGEGKAVCAEPAFGEVGGKESSLVLEKEGDFSLLAKLPNLRALFLWDVDLEDFSFLAECRQLSYLNLWNTKFTDCKILENLPALRYVCLPEEGRLKNLSVLTARCAMEEIQEKEKIWEYILTDGGEDVPPENPLIIKTEPKIPEMEPKGLQKDKGGEQKADKAAGEDGSKQNAEEPFFRDDEFDHLAILRGEQAVLSCGGSVKVRHVSAQFWMDAKLPPVWEKFCQLAWDEDNWARLPADRAKELTGELVRLIRQGDVAVLFLSLDSFGEGPFLTLEFSGDWVAINYMDDDRAVYYSCYNPDYTKGSELSPVEIGGQSPVPKMLALNDLGLAADIVQEFLEHGKLLAGSLWKTNQGMGGFC